MAKRIQNTSKTSEKRFVLGAERGERISAVEGLALTGHMRTILRDTDVRNGSEARRRIKEAVRGKVPGRA